MPAKAATVIYRPRSESRTAFLLMLPVLVFFLVFQYYPILKSVAISFAEFGLLRRASPFVGLENYVRQFQDPLFLTALWNTLIFVQKLRECSDDSPSE